MIAPPQPPLQLPSLCQSAIGFVNQAVGPAATSSTQLAQSVAILYDIYGSESGLTLYEHRCHSPRSPKKIQIMRKLISLVTAKSA